MSKRLFDRDEEAGVTRWWHHDPSEDEVTIQTQQDVTPLVEANKTAYNAAGESWGGDMHRVASIPMSVYYDLKARGIADDPKRLKAWLNDPNNRFFRTKPGKV